MFRAVNSGGQPPPIIKYKTGNGTSLCAPATLQVQPLVSLSHQTLLSPLGPAGAICHLHAKSRRMLPREHGHPSSPWASGTAGQGPCHRPAASTPHPDPEHDFPCHAEVKAGRSRRGGSVSHGRRPELLSLSSPLIYLD